jgi:hypothetical protein
MDVPHENWSFYRFDWACAPLSSGNFSLTASNFGILWGDERVTANECLIACRELAQAEAQRPFTTDRELVTLRAEIGNVKVIAEIEANVGMTTTSAGIGVAVQ